MAATKEMFNSMSAAAANFAAVGIGLASATYAIHRGVDTLLTPFTMLRNAFNDIGLFYEKIHVEILGLLGGNQRMADELFKTLFKASTEIPYSFREMLSGMKEFIFLGLDIGKTFGTMTVKVGNDLTTMTKTGSTAIAGLAAASGASFETIAHDIALAVGSGRADYLTHWIGSLNSQMLQMSGVFVGTYQMQYDKIMNYLNARYGAFGKQLTATFSGLHQNTKDLMDMIGEGVLRLNANEGSFARIRKVWGAAVSELTHFFTTVDKFGRTQLDKLSSLLSDVLSPLAAALEKVTPLFVNFIEKITAFLSDSRHDNFVKLLGWGLGLAGLLGSIAAAAFGATASLLLLAEGVKKLYLLVAPFVTALGPSLLIILGIIGAITVAYYNNWLGFGTMVDGVFQTIYKKIVMFTNFISVLWDIWNTDTKKGVATVGATAWDSLNGTFKWLAFRFLELVNIGKFGSGWVRAIRVVGSEIAIAFIDAMEAKLDRLRVLGTEIAKSMLHGIEDEIVAQLSGGNFHKNVMRAFDLLKFSANVSNAIADPVGAASTLVSAASNVTVPGAIATVKGIASGVATVANDPTAGTVGAIVNNITFPSEFIVINAMKIGETELNVVKDLMMRLMKKWTEDAYAQRGVKS